MDKHFTDQVLKELTDDEALKNAYDLLKQLRENIDYHTFITIYQQAKQANQYTLIGAYKHATLTGLMGYRILHDYVHGKHLYIDDLVVDARHRGKGIGSALLQYAENIAGQLHCNGLRLSTGIAHTEGIKFYKPLVGN